MTAAQESGKYIESFVQVLKKLWNDTMENMHRRFYILYFPGFFVILYLLGTLFLYATGPFAWDTHQPEVFYCLQVCYVVAFFIGYMGGICTGKGSACSLICKKRLQRFLGGLLFVNFIIFLINIFRNYGLTELDFSHMYSIMQMGMKDIGKGYVEHQARMRGLTGDMIYGGRLMTAVNYIWNFWGFNVVLLGIMCFSRLEGIRRAVFLFTCVEILIYYISIGTNIGIFRIVFAILVFGGIAQMQKVWQGEKSLRSMLFAGLVGGCSVFICILYFVATMKGRGGILLWNSGNYKIGGIGLDYGSIFFSILPEELYIPLISLSAYLTQGYYAFSLCLDVPWESTLGLGSSLQIVDILSKHFFDIQSITYQYKIEQAFGWPSRLQWAGMYSWFANDVGIFGVIFIMLFLGYFFSLSWKDSLLHDNLFAKLVFYYLAFACVFIPCNNQVFQSLYTLFPFFSAFCVWLFTRCARRKRVIDCRGDK